ncbi:MAG TPA: small ribosomal subunit Rsm22 family protein, partial [bacterium]|nr:small ribosomal subunit Rsm22 family protein [bacterium]
SLGFLFSLIEKMSVRHQPVHVTVHAFEQNKKILADGVSLLRAFLEAVSAKSMGLTVEVVPYAIDLARGRLPRVLSDVILVGNLLNELGRRDAQQLVLARMLDSLCQKKFLLLMLEPAHKKISRDLQSLRDYLIQRFSLNVVGPCLHSLACPLNQVNKRDWCHQRLIWDVPELIRDFDRLTKLKKVYLQYSYLLLRPDRVAGERSADTFLAITDVMLVGRQKELVACSRGGLYRFVLPAATSQPRFSQLRRGDTFSPMPHVIMHKVV